MRAGIPVARSCAHEGDPQHGADIVGRAGPGRGGIGQHLAPRRLPDAVPDQADERIAEVGPPGELGPQEVDTNVSPP